MLKYSNLIKIIGNHIFIVNNNRKDSALKDNLVYNVILYSNWKLFAKNIILYFDFKNIYKAKAIINYKYNGRWREITKWKWYQY